MEWISVVDSLPRKKGVYLVLMRCRWWRNTYELKTFPTIDWHVCDGQSETIGSWTHWLEIPAHPVTKEQPK